MKNLLPSFPRISNCISTFNFPLSTSLVLHAQQNSFRQIRLISCTNTIYRHHYDILEIPQNADRQLIKSQFYKLSKKYHPDVNLNDENAHSKFLLISEAYSVLINDQSRKEYDRSIQKSIRYRNPANPQTHYSSHHFRPKVRRKNSGVHSNHQHQRPNLKFNFHEHYQRHYGEELRRAKAAAERDRLNNINKEESLKEEVQNRRLLRLILFLSVLLLVGGSGNKEIIHDLK
ncbi:10375_t:CDS:2 [Diversispora eburnea]|uniref:10375_t:CDS:1 n=1 Tax=Diversispora eburnea TaxID=1213867 RepID=A0A9N9CBU8_9GLOM|nr:10375_t:CDS:2 [Diversispora eburnea]